VCQLILDEYPMITNVLSETCVVEHYEYVQDMLVEMIIADGWRLNQTICAALLDEDIARAVTDCGVVFPQFELFPPKAQAAFADMMFNMGRTTFTKFKRMINAAMDWDWQRAADEAKDSKWYRQTGIRARTVVAMIRAAETEE